MLVTRGCRAVYDFDWQQRRLRQAFPIMARRVVPPAHLLDLLLQMKVELIVTVAPSFAKC
jgi:hypothetical protein